MLLTADIGNTQTVIGIFASDQPLNAKPKHTFRITTYKHDSLDDIRVKLRTLLSEIAVDIEDIDRTAIASVVPELTTAWTECLSSMFGEIPCICTAKTAQELGLFDADYPSISEIGADRIADTVAVKQLFGCPAIVVDLGTATNFEVIDEKGRFVGGVIAPGMKTSAEALFSQATRLAATELRFPDRFIGKSSEEAIRSGIMLGEASRLDGIVEGILGELGLDGQSDKDACKVIATGGLSRLIAEHTKCVTDICPELTLIGLRLIAQADALS